MKKFQFKSIVHEKRKIFRFLIEILLFSYVFCIPTFGENTGFFRYFIYAFLVLLMFSSFLYTFLYEKIRVFKSTLLIPAFVIVALIGTIGYSHQFREWLTLVFLCVSFYSLFLAFSIIKDDYKVLSIISIGIGLFCFVFIFYFRDSFLNLSSLASGKLRLGPPFDNANGVSAFSVVCFATSLYLILFFKKISRFLFLFPLGASFLVGVSTGSRSFILFTFVFLLILFFVRFRKRKILCFVVLGMVIAIFVLLFSLPALSFLKFRIVNSLKTIFGTSDKADTSTLSRINYTSYGFYMGSKNLIIGFGSGGFGIVTGMNTYAHSNFAEIICNFGIFGFIIFYLPLIILFIKGITDPKVNKSFIIPFVIYYVFAGITNVLYYKKLYFLMLAFMYYLVYYSPLLKEKKQKAKQNLNICFLADSMGSGGAERVIASLSNEMANLGHTVTILLISSSDEKSYYSLNKDIRLVSLVKDYVKKTSFIKRVFLLRKFYRNNNFDVVYAFLKHVCVYNWISSIGFNFKTVVSERNDPGQYSKMEQFLVRRAFYAADKCVFQTEMAMNWYGNEIKNKSVIIYNPVMLTTSKKNSQRNNHIITVARLEKQKNLDFLIEVFSSFHERNPSYILEIYGDGSLKSELEEKINHLNLDNYVFLNGADKNWQSKEYNASCFLLTSNFEGMPNSLEEAACLGIPCVSSNCRIGGPFELSKELINISLVNGNNVDDYVLAMEKAISSNICVPNTIAFEISNITDRWLKLYE